MGCKERLDKLVVKLGLAQSRERASALIMKGAVLVDGTVITKAGSMVDEQSIITIIEQDIPYVSRGGLKLKASVDGFAIDLNGKTAMDIGASTGGFTDCMLKEGAVRVYSIDVGYGQLDYLLRNDPKVVMLEKTNIRHLGKDKVAEEIDFIAVDVSFISLRIVLPKVLEFLRHGGSMVALIKPQFEVGRKDVSKGGIVRDNAKRLAAVDDIIVCACGLGLEHAGTMESPIKGQKGNVEYLAYFRRV